MLCGISPGFPGLFPAPRQVIHVLLTRSPLYLPVLLPAFSFDLHVLGTPPALILSQDQTLSLIWLEQATPSRRRSKLVRQLSLDLTRKNQAFKHVQPNCQRTISSITGIIAPCSFLVKRAQPRSRRGSREGPFRPGFRRRRKFWRGRPAGTRRATFYKRPVLP